MAKATPFLMFTGQAQAAMAFYLAAFPDARMLRCTLYPTGTVQQAVFSVCGQEIMCTDSPPVHDFTFTPSSSIFVECDDAAQLERLFAVLGEGGKVLMPLGDYGFSQRFGWLNDRFGVSWQLNLPG